MFSKQPQYYIGEQHAAGQRIAIEEGAIYRMPPSAPTVKALVAAGVLRQLVDKPADWVKVREYSAEDLAAVPPPDPEPEVFVGLEEVASQLGWSVDDLQAARTRGYFPAAEIYVIPDFDTNPDGDRQPRWRPSTIELWQNENGGLLARLGALAK